MGGQFRSLGRQIEGGGGVDHQLCLRRRLRRRRHRGQTRLAACLLRILWINQSLPTPLERETGVGSTSSCASLFLRSTGLQW